MSSGRREFMKLAGATVAVASTALTATPAVAQMAGRLRIPPAKHKGRGLLWRVGTAQVAAKGEAHDEYVPRHVQPVASRCGRYLARFPFCLNSVRHISQ